MATTMCFIASLILSAVSIVSANPGQVVAQVPHGPYGEGIFSVLERAYRKFDRTIVALSQDDWNRMSAQDFAKFDAVLALDYEANCNYTDYTPFSNYEEWGGAIRNGNTIILAMEELKPLDHIDQESMDVIDAAAEFSLYDPNNTGAYISLGWMYHKCMGDGPTNATWLDTAFQVEEKDEQKFEIQKVADGRYNMVVSSHPALAKLTDSTLKRRNKRASAKAAFIKYPSDFIPYAVAKSLNNKPFILLKESKNPLSGNPSSSPTNLAILTPTVSPTFLSSATLSKSASVQLSARPSTASTKKIHCSDNADFYVNNDDSKTCQWIGSEASRLRKFCVKEYVAINCPSTCKMDCRSRNPSVAPTKLPTLTPTASPTSNPSATPSKSASARLSARPTMSSTKRPSVVYQHDLMPGIDYQHDLMHHCPDNADFYVNNDDSKTCQWIGSEASRLRKFCAKEYVTINCPSTCKMDCRSRNPSVAPTNLPTLTPTASPTSIPSATPSNNSGSPSVAPTNLPTLTPTASPTSSIPSATPSNNSGRPSVAPTNLPTLTPTASPTSSIPSATPSNNSGSPSVAPTNLPTLTPTASPTSILSATPSKSTSFPKTSALTDIKSTKGTNSKKKSKTSRKRVKKIAKNWTTEFMVAKKASKALKTEKKSKSSKS